MVPARNKRSSHQRAVPVRLGLAVPLDRRDVAFGHGTSVRAARARLVNELDEITAAHRRRTTSQIAPYRVKTRRRGDRVRRGRGCFYNRDYENKCEHQNAHNHGCVLLYHRLHRIYGMAMTALLL